MQAAEANLSRQVRQVIRVTCAVLTCTAVVASAMAIKGWQTASFLLAGIIVLLGSLLVFQVARTLGAMRRHSHSLVQSARGAEEHYVVVLRRIVKFVEARDKYTHGRSDRIGKLSELIARRLGQSEDACRMLNLAGQLHDIGLLSVPEGILNKRSTLGSDDFRTVQKHSEVSAEVLKPLTMLSGLLPAIRSHHERMNGTGYPRGLSGRQIPLEARILAVADAYDAMTHDRPHRPALTPLEAMKELRRCSPAGYDPECVNALAGIVNLEGIEAAMKSVEEVPMEMAAV